MTDTTRRRPERVISLRLALLAALAGVIAVIGVSFDQPISASLRAWEVPGDLEKAINLSEAFAHSTGVAAILIALLLNAAPSRRRLLWIAVLITAVSGLTANGLKACFVRVRPHSADSIQVSSTSAESGDSVVEASFWDARQRSFPSGHAATAWGLMIGLSLVYPRSTLLFAFLALLASLQRITSGAHYLSDVGAGAAIAFFSAAVIVLFFNIPRQSEMEVDSADSGRAE